MSVYRRGARWRAQYRHPGTGQRVSKTFPTKREATAWVEDNGSEVRAGTWRPPNKVTVAEACRAWLADRKAAGMRESTASAYHDDIEHHIVPRLGAVKLADLTTGAIESALIARMFREGKAEATVRRALAPLSQALQRGVRHGLVRQNVAREIDWREVVPKGREPRPRVSYTPRQLARLVEHAPDDEARAFLGILAGGGLRVGEGLGLRGRDLGARTVCVEQQVYRGRIGPPKSRSGVRVVPVLPAYRWALDAARELAGDRHPDALVFADARGAPRDSGTIDSTWLRRAQRAAGLPESGFHAIRRSYALALNAAGVSPADARDLLGHATANLSVDVYQGRESDPAATLARLEAALGTS